MTTTTQTKESYEEFRDRQQQELNNFKGMFFAFNDKQFEKGMGKIGLEPSDTKSLLSIGAGGYILKSKSKDFTDMFKRHEAERREYYANKENLIKSLAYELSNHEFIYTYDPQDAVEAIGYTMKSIDRGILKKAIALHNENNQETRQ